MVHIPRESRNKVYKYLFEEGVLVAPKDTHLEEHKDVKAVSNLHVMMLMKSLKSREFVRENFNWQWHYYYLTNEGMKYLRETLNMPSDVVPKTLIQRQGPRLPGARGPGGNRRDYGGPRGGDREGYRKFADDRKFGPGGDYNPEQQRRGGGGGYGGFGRGRTM